MYFNGVKIYQFEAKDSEMEPYPLGFSNISKDFTVDNMKNIGFNEYVYDFFVDVKSFDINNIADVHKYLIKKHNIK